MAQIIESFLQGKDGSADGGEDRLIIHPEGICFGVVDGATDTSGNKWKLDGEDVTGGTFLAETIRRRFTDTFYLRGMLTDVRNDETIAKDVRTALLEINKSIHAGAVDAGIDLHDPQNRPAASFVLFIPASRTVYSVGDCQFGFITKRDPMIPEKITVVQEKKAIDILNAELRATVNAWAKKRPYSGSTDLGRAFIMHLLQAQGELQNQADTSGEWFGIPKRLITFSIVDGSDISFSVHKLPDSAEELVLASDGFMTIKPTLEKTLRQHEEMLAHDPECTSILKGTKGRKPGNVSYDDRAYLRLDIT